MLQKETVRDKYNAIALGRKDPGFCMSEESRYKQQPGYQAEADLGLGCGSPVDYADLKSGETVLDLGSGAGLDALMASPLVGKTGKIIGIDLAESMVAKATENAAKASVKNVFFQEGDIEQLPLEDATIDVVISNCTLNLVPDKTKAFSEIPRVLRSGGRFVISDAVTIGNTDPVLLSKAQSIAGTGSGSMESYLSIIHSTGFTDVEIVQCRFLQIVDGLEGFASLTILAQHTKSS